MRKFALIGNALLTVRNYSTALSLLAILDRIAATTEPARRSPAVARHNWPVDVTPSQDKSPTTNCEGLAGTSSLRQGTNGEIVIIDLTPAVARFARIARAIRVSAQGSYTGGTENGGTVSENSP